MNVFGVRIPGVGLRCACTAAVVLATLLSAPGLAAETYYVRADGGSASQCTGLSDAPYPGSGSAQDCAWSHPFVALPPGGSPRIHGGDTLIIGPGDYRMGIGAPETGTCQDWYSFDCHMPPVPSGPSPNQPTRILGQGHDSGCSAAPELWGSERAEMVINLHGSSNVELACLDITDRGDCGEFHCSNGNCPGPVAACDRSSPPFGDWARQGISARDSASVSLRDLDIHGLANNGILAGRLTDWTLEGVSIRANAWAGWDGGVGDDSSNSGTIEFRDSELSWNGCLEDHATGEPFGCWAQQAGGYGDGIGTYFTDGHWKFIDSEVMHNTSDGIDLLYLEGNAQVTIRRTRVEGNAGNQIKVARSARIENSVVVGNCGYFEDHPNMLEGDHCRALGDSISIGLGGSIPTELVNNTITGQGNCLISGGGSGSVTFANNLLLGKPYFLDPDTQTCGYYTSGNPDQSWISNFVTDTRNNFCPGDSQCGDSPQLLDESLSSFDPEPVEHSPLLDSGHEGLAPPDDFFGLPRGVGNGPDVGAVEWGTEDEDRIFSSRFES